MAKERLDHKKAGEEFNARFTILMIQSVVGNVLDEIDKGKSTKELRKDLAPILDKKIQL